MYYCMYICMYSYKYIVHMHTYVRHKKNGRTSVISISVIRRLNYYMYVVTYVCTYTGSGMYITYIYTYVLRTYTTIIK